MKTKTIINRGPRNAQKEKRAGATKTEARVFTTLKDITLIETILLWWEGGRRRMNKM